MACTRCGSERLYQFEASPSVRVRAAPLPLVCRKCGLISIDGQPVNLPEALERQAMDMAEAAEAAGKEARETLEATDPADLRIEKYFAQVYRKAYLDGFFRCLAFYQHHAKEGRLVRMRKLWEGGGLVGDIRPGRPERKGVLMDIEAYTEFEQLLCVPTVKCRE